MELKNKYIVLTGSKGLIGKAIVNDLKEKIKLFQLIFLKFKNKKM